MAGGKTLDYPKSKVTKAKYDKFVRLYIANNRNGAKAAKAAGYSEKGARQKAAQLLTIRYIQEEIEKHDAEQKQSFDEFIESEGLTMRDRVKMANMIFDAGIRKSNGRFNDLSAANRALNTLNEMIGDDEENDDSAQSFEVSFNVKPAKGNVKVTNA